LSFGGIIQNYREKSVRKTDFSQISKEFLQIKRKNTKNADNAGISKKNDNARKNVIAFF